MVSLDGVDDDGIFLVLPGQVRAQLYMAALHLVVNGLAQVVQQACPLGHGDVHAQFRGHKPRNVGYLDGVVQHVLTIGGAVFLTSQNLNELWVQVVNAGLVAGPLAFLPNGAVHFLPGLFHHILNAGGMDSAVDNQFLQGKPRHLPADGIEAADRDGLRGVVNDQVHTGDGFQGADVPALPADDPALHFVVGQGHHGDSGLSGVIGGAALDGGGDDFPALFLGLVLELGLDFLDLHGSFVADVLLHGLKQVFLGLLLGQLGDPFQGLQMLFPQFLGLGLGFADLLQLPRKLVFLALKSLSLLVQGGFFLL